MFLKRITINCYHKVDEHDNTVRFKKILEGVTLEQAIDNAKRYFKAFCIVKDYDENAVDKYGCFINNVYLSDGRQYGNEDCEIVVYNLR